MIAHGKGKKTERNVEIVRERENDEAIDHQESFPIHVHTFFLLCHNNGEDIFCILQYSIWIFILINLFVFQHDFMLLFSFSCVLINPLQKKESFCCLKLN